jgi:sigma-B regulation protein RsbU (phosphoserine phosphatase)
VSFRFAHEITRPIVELGDAVSLVSGGNIRMAQGITSDTEELDRLASSFNAMMGRLNSYVSNLADVTAEKERFSAQINVASVIQLSMLPRKFPPQHGRNNVFDLYAMMRPANEVGGDFYDFFFVDNSHFAILVGDVASVGVPAALFMSISKTLIRAYLKQGYSLDLALSEVNRALCDNNELDIFVTVWAGMIDLNEKKLQFVNSGHFSPYLKTSEKTFLPIQTPSDPPLGFMEDSVYHCKETNINKGNVLFLYTDGVINAIGKNGEQYEARRLKSTLEANADKTMRELLTIIKNGIVEFSKSREQNADITMLGIKLM